MPPQERLCRWLLLPLEQLTLLLGPTPVDLPCEFLLLLEVLLLEILEIEPLVDRVIVLTLRDDDDDARDETDEKVSDSQEESDDAVSSKIGELDSFVSHPSEA